MPEDLEAPSELNMNLARNLRALMKERELTQMQLAEKCGVSQTAISLYLDPGRRKPSATGKKPSATLAQVEMLAGAFGVEAWVLLRPMNEAKLRAYAKLEEVAHQLAGSATEERATTEKEGTHGKGRKHATEENP